jgi:hypothetical protein
MDQVNILRRWLFVCGLAVLIIASGCAQAPPPSPPAPPSAEVSAKIANAKTVFVSNLGSDAIATNYIAGGANESYVTFCSSLKQWGHFTLVDSSSKADLIFEIYTTVKPEEVGYDGVPHPNGDEIVLKTYPAVVTLTIKDASRSDVLWSTHFNIPLRGNTTKGKEKDYALDMEGLTTRVKALVSSRPAVP